MGERKVSERGSKLGSAPSTVQDSPREQSLLCKELRCCKERFEVQNQVWLLKSSPPYIVFPDKIPTHQQAWETHGEQSVVKTYHYKTSIF